jgi:predicted ribosome quality control (RQC) complex YloA/Tae2 family protein
MQNHPLFDKHHIKVRNIIALVKENLSTRFSRFYRQSFLLIFENEAHFNILLIKIDIPIMPVHYFTLKALCQELDSVFSGSVIRSIYTQKKDELIIRADKTPAGESDLKDTAICISVAPRSNYIFFKKEISRARRNSVDLFSQVIDSTIKDINIHPSDRSIFISLNSSQQFVVQLYNTAASNIYLTDDSYNIIEVFKNNRNRAGGQLLIPEHNSSPENIYDGLRHYSDTPILASLRKMVPLLGIYYAQETLHRSSIDGNILAGNLSEKDLIRLNQEVMTTFNLLKSPAPHIYNISEKQLLISLIELRHMQNIYYVNHRTVNDAVKNFISLSSHELKIETAKDEIIKKLKEVKSHTERAIKNASLHDAVNPEDLEKKGNILLANLHQVKKGMKIVTLEDAYQSGNPIEITLDPALTPVQNAERFFSKSKILYQKHIEEERRLKELNSRSKIVIEMIEVLEKISSTEEVEKYKKNYYKHLQSMNIKTNKNEEEKPPFRIFTVAGGFEVWVGKSSANNDLLTTKYCKPHDLWFHARGAGGSHTVLKIPRGIDTVPRESIKQAASIAAYYSKMRNASNVSVAYCERKYVRKPKGVAEGTVFLEREEVIFVPPKLP